MSDDYSYYALKFEQNTKFYMVQPYDKIMLHFKQEEQLLFPFKEFLKEKGLIDWKRTTMLM